MGEAATDGAAIAHLNIADAFRSFWKKRARGVKEFRFCDFGMSGEGADRDFAALFANVGHAAEFAEIDYESRRGEAQLHQRKKAVAAGEKLGFIAVAIEEANRFFERFGRVIFECRGNHFDLRALPDFFAGGALTLRFAPLPPLAGDGLAAARVGKFFCEYF